MRLLQRLSKNSTPNYHATWQPSPTIYEINTWVWLRQLSKDYNQTITLDTVPSAEIEKLASYNVDAIWMMGVWHRGEATRNSALNYIHEYESALHDITPDDVGGSAYAIGGYHVEEVFGGRNGLAIFRNQLRQHGIKLILDYVPNHVSTDHPWIHDHPEYFIQGTKAEGDHESIDFFHAETADRKGAVVARGRDPYFPPWIDTTQFNAFSPALRQATIDTLIDIGKQCDGVRCDMAMLMMNDIFYKTWGARAGQMPTVDFWNAIIPAVRAQHPNLLFMAEVYWNREHDLQQQGFDYTYDKTLYDRMVTSNVGKIKAHLSADLSYLQANVRFIENHDEPRAMHTFGLERQRPAAVLICTLPGATLLHDGQFQGRRIKLPVQINRQPDEPKQPLLEHFYAHLLHETSNPIYKHGVWQMLDVTPAFDSDVTHHNLIAYSWQDADQYRIVVVNLTVQWSHGMLDLTHWTTLSKHNWQLYDALSKTYAYHDGNHLATDGLSVDVAPYGAHIYNFKPARHIPNK